MSDKVQLECLYTKHKTQKRKKWNDGKAVIDKRSGRLRLYNAVSIPGASNAIIDELELERNEIEAIIKLLSTDLETENFLVTIEGPWTGGGDGEGEIITTTTQKQQNLPQTKVRNRSIRSGGGMQKLLSKKFRLPPTRIPPPPEEKMKQMLEDEQSRTNQRKRPLQVRKKVLLLNCYLFSNYYYLLLL